MKIKEKAKKAASHIWKHKWKYAAATGGALLIYYDVKMLKTVKDIGLNRVLCTAAKIPYNVNRSLQKGERKDDREYDG